MTRAASCTIAAVAIVLFTGTAEAQGRPSLERIEEYLCLAADEAGATWRPAFCAPRCDCSIGLVAPTATCGQTAPGAPVDVVAAGPLSSGTCHGRCTLDSFLGCANDAECAAASAGTCEFAPFVPVCVLLTGPDCVNDFQCDSAKGYFCSPSIYPGAGSKTKVCQRAEPLCNAPGTCDSNVESFDTNLSFEFAPPGSLAPLTCLHETPTNISVNSVDMAECIGQVEAVIGTGACIICGDGDLDTGEQCDDGNVDPGDGCAADCTTE